MRRRLLLIIGATLVALVLLLKTKMGRSAQDYSPAVSPADRAIEANDDRMIAEGDAHSGSTRLATRHFGTTRCTCTKRLPAGSSAASGRA